MMRSLIEKYGYTMYFVGEDEKDSAYAYTFGRFRNNTADKLLIGSITPVAAQKIIDEVCNAEDKGDPLTIDSVLTSTTVICASNENPTKFSIRNVIHGSDEWRDFLLNKMLATISPLYFDEFKDPESQEINPFSKVNIQVITLFDQNNKPNLTVV